LGTGEAPPNMQDYTRFHYKEACISRWQGIQWYL